MTTASCLITSTPDFESPDQTPPFLQSQNATPDPRQIVVLQPDKDEITFSAFLRSEDANENVLTRLLLDYGTEFDGLPYTDSDNGTTLLPSGMEDRSRVASGKFRRGSFGGDITGCHRFTLMVSHAFNDNDCPVDLADSDAITWSVYICPKGSGDACPPMINPAVDCALPPKPAACPQFSPQGATSSSSGAAQ